MNQLKCYHTHPAINLPEVEGTLYGGNGYAPVKKADWYIDLNPRNDVTPHQLYDTKDGGKYTNFPIPNMGVPNIKKLRNLVQSICEALEKGTDVHIGCIGGHGRTGLVLAAVVRRITGNLDSIDWVRNNYCVKAVESQKQVEYLERHFGIKPVKPRYDSSPSWVIGDL